MTPADRERVKDLLEQAARLEPRRRKAFIESAAAENREIASEALELLHTLDDPKFMHSPTGAGFEAGGARFSNEGPGSRIGRYKLLQLIGEGGFGAVYMAEQDEPVRRRVALKIIKAGMDTRQVIARFEAERQALAMMDHPNIARVFDAGATDAGRPYFVMELVRGQRVTTYCDEQRLSVSDRLELFRSVCHAVQHAHQKGIIHRDLKPSNVLVTVADGRPVSKVIDFGIAKATQTRLTDKTLFTEMHQLIGTPEYMSPEQAEVSGVDIDTRSDVYSLGVMLYELLAGSTPLELGRLRSTPLAEIQRLICEEDPPRPSLRFATLASSHGANHRTPLRVNGDSSSSALDIAKSRQVDPVHLTRALRGDLDWIVMKCLEKDRSRRYATANALAEDVGRFLQHHPVLASPPSRGYRVRKFVTRNKSVVIAGAVVAAVLVLGIIGTTLGLVRAVREQTRTQQQKLIAEQNAERADREAEQTRAVAEFQAAMLADIDPQSMGLKLRSELLDKTRDAAKQSGLSAEEIDTRLAELQETIAGVDFTGMGVASLDANVFQNAVSAIDEKFAEQPLIKAQLLETLAGVQRKLGLLDTATRQQERALAIRREELGDAHLDTLTSLGNLGELRLAQGKLEEGESILRDCMQSLRRTAPDHPFTYACMASLGHAAQELGKLEEAEALYREAWAGLRRVRGDEDRAH